MHGEMAEALGAVLEASNSDPASRDFPQLRRCLESNLVDLERMVVQQ